MHTPRGRRVAGVRILALTQVLVAATGVTISVAGAGRSRPLMENLLNGPGVINHPTHMRPSGSVRVPAGWPLDSDGTVTCVTCHERVPALDGADDSRYLRGVDEGATPTIEFCAKCHGLQAERTAGAMHWLAVGRAHITPREDRGPTRGSGVDVESRRCLVCHDGVTASDRENSNSGAHGGSFGGRTGNHPVGVDYPTTGARAGRMPLRPAGLLPDNVRLPGGQVSCVSCHNLYALEQNRLTIPMEESALCFTCHDMN